MSRIGRVKVHFSVVYRGEREGKAPRHHVTKRVRKHAPSSVASPFTPDPCSFTGLHLTCGNGSGTGATFAFVPSPESPMRLKRD